MLSLSKETTFTIICGILSGSIFAFSSYNPDAGLLVLFMPLLPLAIAGLSLSARHCMVAALIACVTAGIGAGPDYLLFFVVLIVLPLLHFIRKVLLCQGEEEAKQWYPVLPVLTELTLMTSVILAGFILILGHSEPGDLAALVSKALHKQMDAQLAGADPKFTAIMKTLTDEWNFVVFACMGWLWVMMLYTFTVIANTFLRANGIALRPYLGIMPGGLPLWLPFFLLVAAGLTLLGNGNDHYLGETLILILLLPYFLSGVASFHGWSQHWPARWVWLILFYFILLVFPGLSAFVIAKGLHAQIEELFKKRQALNDH